jgi:hypothetical protein
VRVTETPQPNSSVSTPTLPVSLIAYALGCTRVGAVLMRLYLILVPG